MLSVRGILEFCTAAFDFEVARCNQMSLLSELLYHPGHTLSCNPKTSSPGIVAQPHGTRQVNQFLNSDQRTGNTNPNLAKLIIFHAKADSMGL